MIKPTHFLLILIGAFAVFCVAIAIFVSVVTSDGMPSLEQLENPKQNLATSVLSADGVLLDHFFIERRVPLAYDSIPKYFIKALVATEDKKFWDHWGVHTGRVINSAIKNILSGHKKEGASTITMQLARNLYQHWESSFTRKIREAVTAVQIERTYTKEEIIAMYTNAVVFGRGAYGLNVAAQVYFDKQPGQLTLAECALLVAMLKAPENYNPLTAYDRALRRRNLVLSLMLDQEAITPFEYQKAMGEPINVYGGDRGLQRKNLGFQIAPHFVEYIRQALNNNNSLKDYDLYRDGLVINTSLNSKIQNYANRAVDEHLKEFQAIFNKRWSWNGRQSLLQDILKKAIRNRPDYRAAEDSEKGSIERRLMSSQRFIDSVKNVTTTVQVGLIVIDPQNGAVLGMVGASPKFMHENKATKYSLNHATQIKRQPGSSFKPFVYASALQHGLTPSSMVECGPYSYQLPTGEVWSPKGTGSCGPGESRTLISALAGSINTVSARLITTVTTPSDVVSLAQKMGIESKLNAVPSLSLGAGEVRPIEMVSAYCAFANHGIHVQPYFFSKIEDHNGAVLFDKKASSVTDALDKKTVAQMTMMMQAVVNNGTGSSVRQYFKNCDAAGKTGTTDDAADAWFIGYTPQLVCGIWMGFDDKRITFDCIGGEGYGGKAAAPLWGRLMAKIYADPGIPYKQRQFEYGSFSDSTTASVEGGSVEPYSDETPEPRDTTPAKPKREAKIQNSPAIPPLPKKKTEPMNRNAFIY